MAFGGVVTVATEGADVSGGVVEGRLVEAVVDEDKEAVLEAGSEWRKEGVEIRRGFGHVAF